MVFYLLLKSIYKIKLGMSQLKQRALVLLKQLQVATLKYSNSSIYKISTFPKTKKKITIGRDPSCTLRVDKNNDVFSKIHITAEYKEEEKSWVVYDGTEAKPSTNGVWLFVQKPYKITSNTQFKLEESLFSIEVVNN